MHQHFVLTPTPAIARRLLFMAGYPAKLTIDPAIQSMAREGLMDRKAFVDTMFASTNMDMNVCRSAAQFILDCGCRCAISEVRGSEHVVLAALRLGGVDKVTVATTENLRVWKQALKGYAFKDVKAITSESLADYDQQTGRRDGVLVVDWSGGRYGEISDQMLGMFCREFERTIILVPSNTSHLVVEIIAHALFPDLPLLSMYPHDPRNFPHLLVYYNVFLASQITGYDEFQD